MIDKVLNGLETALDYVSALPASFWWAVGFTIGIAVITSTIIELINHRHAVKHEKKLGKRTVTVLLAWVGFMGSAADSVLTSAPLFASPVLQRFAWILVTAKVYHDFIGKPLVAKILKATKDWSEGKKFVPQDLLDEPETPSEPVNDKEPIPQVTPTIWS
jgi:hypothetical protein